MKPVLALWPVLPQLLCAQAAPRTAREFLDAARAATARYRDPQAALADGYRAIGPDFPSMGEHWIHPGLLVGGQLDVAHPQILEYATIAGRRQLVGVAYGALVRDSTVPAAFPVERAAWHFHGGTVDEESFLRSHIGAGHDHWLGPRLAVLHAWVWLENPSGAFATDNWALPYARLGLEPPRAAPVTAARALSLAGGGDVYWAALLRALGQPDSAETARLRRVLASYRGVVAAWLAGRPESAQVAAPETARLEQVWRDLCAAIDSAVSAPVAGRLRSIRDADR